MSQRPGLLFALIVVGLAGALVEAQERARPSAPASARTTSITVANGLLTAHIRRQPLGSVLEEIASRTDVALSAPTELQSDVISGDLEKMPLDDALRQLFGKYDAFFYYGGAEGTAPKLRAVWIYPRGGAVAMQPASPDAWATRGEFKALLADRNPAIREQAYDALMSRPDAESRELVARAIRGETEPDGGVRQRILSSALSRGLDLPPDLLPYLAAADPSEEMRLMALDGMGASDDLTSNPEVKAGVQAASGDPSAAVRERARQILADIAAAERRRR